MEYTFVSRTLKIQSNDFTKIFLKDKSIQKLVLMSSLIFLYFYNSFNFYLLELFTFLKVYWEILSYMYVYRCWCDVFIWACIYGFLITAINFHMWALRTITKKPQTYKYNYIQTYIKYNSVNPYTYNIYSCTQM